MPEALPTPRLAVIDGEESTGGVLADASVVLGPGDGVGDVVARGKPSVAKKLGQKLKRAAGGYRVAAALRQRSGGEPDLRTLIQEFLDGTELTMSAHVARMDALIAALHWKSSSGRRLEGLTAGMVRAAAGSSEAIASEIYREVAHKASHKSKRVLDTLHARSKLSHQYALTKAADGGRALKVLVAGGGPVGLRAACEVAMLGHAVTVMEPRDECSRLNVLKLWEETVADLDRFALSLIDGHYSNGRDARASTSRLQLALLKAALLLGVHVVLGPKLGSLYDAKGYDVLLLATGSNPSLLGKFYNETNGATSHILASGSKLDDGEKPFEMMPAPDNKTAIAVVCHFEYTDATPEAAQWMKEFVPFDWTVQDALGADDPEKLKSMQARFGLYCVSPAALSADDLYLENVVAYSNKGSNKRDKNGRVSLDNVDGVPPSFYFIFTLRDHPKRPLAEQVKALVTLQPGDEPPAAAGQLLRWAKAERRIPDAAVDDLAKRVVRHFTANYTSLTRKAARGGEKADVVAGGTVAKPLPDACRLLREADGVWRKSCDLFDFSNRNCMRSSAEAVAKIGFGDRAVDLGDRPLLVMPVGDALQEPFWPEGLGVNRGMHNAADAAWCANKWAVAQRDPKLHDELIAERQALYQQFTLQMHGKNRQMLRGYRADNTRVDGSQAHKAYSADPASRYRGYKDKVLGTWAAGVPARQATDAPDVRRGR